MRDPVVAMLVARLAPITAASNLGEVRALGSVDEEELYTALDDDTDDDGEDGRSG